MLLTLISSVRDFTTGIDRITFQSHYSSPLCSSAIYIVTSTLHPLIPTTFVVTVGTAAKRLQSKNIASTQPDTILVAALCDMAFFDKTGTLTKQDMDLESLECLLTEGGAVKELCEIGIAVCHTLSLTSKGEIIGSHVDMAVFASTGAELTRGKGLGPEIATQNETYTILRRFEFDNKRKTQSVIIQDKFGALYAFVKGSPEAIKAASLPFFVPHSFDDSIQTASRSAVYQLAIAFKIVPPNTGSLGFSDISRDEIEKDLVFGGFLNFRNKIREDSFDVIQELKDASIATAMITGDNALTGVTVAREIGMIAPSKTVFIGRKCSESVVEWMNMDNSDDKLPTEQILDEILLHDVELAITGEAWTILRETNLDQAFVIGKNVRVFGRCSPSDKASIVSCFSERGHTTLMCGDGQNDCGCLGAASVGIALSTAEASIVAPFTSLDKSISAVTQVLREGRGASASALASYSAYIMYGQLSALVMTMCAYFGNYLADYTWLFLDCVWAPSMGFSIPLAMAAKRLSPRRPTTSLISGETLASVGGTIAWNFLFMTIGFISLWNQEWFPCRKISSDHAWAGSDAYESQVMFLIAASQVIINGTVLNFGYTFRQSWCKNYVLNFFSFAWFLFILLITLHPSKLSCFFRVNCVNEVS
jgi:magnesium-transporting ATPase (P-type)